MAFSQGWIYAVGKDNLLKVLIKLPQATYLKSQAGEKVVAFPANRAAFLTAEALASPVSVSQEYNDAREAAMSYPEEQLNCIQKDLETRSRFRRKLLPHQLSSILFALPKRGIINASEQGLGKTTVGWCMAFLWGAKRVLIVCPKSLMRTWEAEWAAIWEGEKPFGITVLDQGSKTERNYRLSYKRNTPAEFPVACVVNYEVVADLTKGIRDYSPDCIIMDESFRVKNPDAKCTESLTKISDSAKNILLLTGTPVGNNGAADLYSQLRMLGSDLVPDTYWSFVARYSIMEQKHVGTRTVTKPVGLADPVGLMQLLDPVWFRATKETCLQLPPKQHHIVKLKLHPDVQKWYDALEKDGECVLGNPLSLSGNRVVNVRLHQICGGHLPQFDAQAMNDKEVLLDSGESDPNILAHQTYRMLAVPCRKIEWLQDFAQDRLKSSPHSRAIVWVRYNTERARIGAELGDILGAGRVAEVWGKTGNQELEKIKESFNSRDEDGVQVIVAQIKKMSHGHNLQACDYMIYFSNDWSYVQRIQSEDRAHRMGREGTVTYYDLLIDGTIDEEIKDALIKHEDFAGRIARHTV